MQIPDEILSPILTAIDTNDAESLPKLLKSLQQQQDPDGPFAIKERRQTFLHYAAGKGKLKYISISNSISCFCWPTLDFLSSLYSDLLLSWILKILFFVGSAAVVKFFINRKETEESLQALLQVEDERGWKAIHCAAAENRSDCLSVFLKRGCDPNSRTSDLNTPLHFIAKLSFADKTKKVIHFNEPIGLLPPLLSSPLPPSVIRFFRPSKFDFADIRCGRWQSC